MRNNRFLCDCRLLWLFDLRNNTKNEDLRLTLQQVKCLYDIKGIYGTPSLTHGQLKEYSRSQPHDTVVFDEDYYDDTGHRKPGVVVQKKYSTSRSGPDTGPDKSQLQPVTLMMLRKDTILPCPKELDEPTELPLSRESIGLDMGWRSSVTATSDSSACLRSLVLLGTL
uniref:LRRCT domain-containing protein n=1 Tax=Anopheles christyi TaxID=43041 RepID=A0A182JUJ4_9DIPT